MIVIAWAELASGVKLQSCKKAKAVALRMKSNRFD
jgi:hypothetical protein